MPCPFTGSRMFCAGPKIWLHLVPLQKLLCWHKNQFYWMQIIFLSGTKCLWLPKYVNKFLVWHKKFGPAQNILGPVKGEGIRSIDNKTFKEFWFVYIIFFNIMHYHGKKFSKLQFLSSIEQFVNICLYFCDFFTLGSCLSNPPFILTYLKKIQKLLYRAF